MEAPTKVLDLVERFQRNQDAYKKPAYNEAQVRKEFIDPFFKALGWDMDNESGYAEAYKDVIHEDAIKIAGHSRAPDYSFRIGGARKFFVEAKKPAINLGEDPDGAYQLRRYAWSAKLPLSILANFQELAVYDCRVKPDKADKASHSRVLFLKYTDYRERWEEISGIFSREAILKGSFDKYAESQKAKKGTTQVDAAFLAEIERWRETLARNLALRNPGLTQRELNFAVQITIDRLIFLRICEDRGIEPYGRLMALQNGDRVYKRLFELFDRADIRYNSGLFHFKQEKGRGSPVDSLTPNLTIDDKVLKDIFKNLYYPDSPYEFSVLPADLLGQVYEQFLGKVIRLTPGHQAKVEYKPEVRKAGGVYYTPTYIVDYIVRQTVGKLLEGKQPGPRRGLGRLKILDPACGSGSFLLGAYQFLLDQHLQAYIEDDPHKWAAGRNPRLYPTSGNGWKLTVGERKRILLEHIYGVDIDSQAVEVTKLSLLLKILEGEDERSFGQESMFHRVLPDLGDNIKCGNSLIGPDYFHGRQLTLTDSEETYRINAFDWRAEFPEIMAGGGFDAVIGNPPYIRIQTLKEWAPQEVEFYKQRYQSAGKGNYDIYVVFVEKGLSLLNRQGRLGFILPHKFFNAQYGEALRALIAAEKSLAQVVHFGDQQVFAGASTYTCLLFLQKSVMSECHFVKVDNLTEWRNSGKAIEGTIPESSIYAGEWNFVVGKTVNLFDKLRRMQVKLGDVGHLFVGLQTDADKVFILEEILVNKDSKSVLCKSKSTSCEHWFENDHLKLLLKGSLNIKRYYLSNLNKRLIFPYDIKDNKSFIIDPKDYKRHYPLTWNYLEENRKRLSDRNRGKMGTQWYGYVYKKNHNRFGGPKILVPSIAQGSCFAIDLEGKYYFVGSGGGGGGGYGITLISDKNISYHYLLGLLNSRLMDFYLKTISTQFRGGYIALNRQYISQLPIRTIDFDDSADQARHDRMVAMVENMLAWNQQLAAPKSPQEITVLQRQIAATDRLIDELVYELYGVTEAEIRLVEGE